MRLFSTLVLVLLLDTLMCFSSPAYATTIFQDDFEGQTIGNALVSCTPPIGGGSYSRSGLISSSGNILDDNTDPPGGGAGNSQQFVGGAGGQQDLFGKPNRGYGKDG